MKLGIITTTHVRSAAALGALRVLVDSLRPILATGAYEFVIVDDCSPAEPAGPYYAYLEAAGIARVYRLGPPAQPYWAVWRGEAPAADGRTSFGHASGIMAGFHALRVLGCTHGAVIDTDCVVLDPALFTEAARRLAATGAAVVTDYFNAAVDEGDAVVDAVYWRREGKAVVKGTLPGKAAWALYGFPVLFCAVVDLVREPLYGFMQNAGWVNSRWGTRLFQRGDTVAYFPFFTGRKAFHLGLGFVKSNIPAAAVSTPTFGNAVETARYAGKEIGLYHAGYLQLDRSSAEYTAWLAFAAQPPFNVPILLPREWLVDPPRVVHHESGNATLRPLTVDDFAAIRTIDADPEATRFFSWGGTPRSTEQTWAFIQAAAATRWRWFVWVDGTGAVVGLGELKPEEPTEHEHACAGGHARPYGMTYAIARAHWGKGYGTALFDALYEAAYNQLAATTLTLRIDVENRASLRVAAKAASHAAWLDLGTEPYTLRGEARQRRVLRRSFNPGPVPSEDPVEAYAEREDILFGQMKIAPFTP